ncbi:flagellar hook-length control protein FliK [Desulfogranum japonicum]|uniref:flagellar hook-length control protein FliK n=1 Tax=Desulfogranum japonicum TaxID=231447 RepID=UPI0004028888|nr:flagellar hook-length control protein FliK [Desulfogranum japonicum]
MDIKKASPPLIPPQVIPAPSGLSAKTPLPLPLHLGQIGTATILSRAQDGGFLLDMQGFRFNVNSSLDLQVGQKFTFQVASLQPQVELQLLGDTIKSRITGSFHLLSRQQDLSQQLATLQTDRPAFTALSQNSRQTLVQVQELTSGLTRALSQTPSTVPSPQVSLLQELSAVLTQTIPVNVGDRPASSPAPIANFPDDRDITRPIQQFLRHALESILKTGSTADTQRLTQKIVQLIHEQKIPLITANKELAASETMLQEIYSQTAKTQGVVATQIQQITTLFTGQQTLFPTRQLADILFIFLAPLKSPQTAPPAVNGQDLQQLTEKLGLHFEKMLLHENTREATNTLKFAALEMEQSAISEPERKMASQILQTIDTYQLLQGKLSAEALLFLPLPLPFLEQGFLLVDQETQNEDESAQPDDTKRFTLHLKLEGLGNLNIQLSSARGKVDILFKAEDLQRTRFLAENKQQLYDWLTAAEIGSVSFLTGAREPAKILLSYLTENDTGLVNTQI